MEQAFSRSTEPSHEPDTRLMLEWLLVALAWLVVNLLSNVLQPSLSFMAGRAWELGTYFDLASRFRQGLPITGSAPAVYRIGVPWLVGHLPIEDLGRGFFYLNLIASALTAALLTLWLRYFIGSWKLRLGLIIFYLIHWLGPTRFIYYTAGGVDSVGLLTLMLGLFLVERYRRGHQHWPDVLFIVLATVVGVAVRETALVIPLVFGFVVLRSSGTLGSRVLRAAVPIALGFVVMLVLHTEVSPPVQPDSYNFLGAALNWFYSKPLPTYLLGWFLTFGLVLVLPLIRRSSLRRFATETNHLLLYGVIFGILAYIGGSDTERILFWAMPAMLVLIGFAFEEMDRSMGAKLFVGTVLLLQLITERAFWNTPDLGYTVERSRIFLTSLSSSAYYLNLFSYHAPRSVSALMLIEYVGIASMLLAVGWKLVPREREN